jgi:hypothetical protein
MRFRDVAPDCPPDCARHRNESQYLGQIEPNRVASVYLLAAISLIMLGCGVVRVLQQKLVYFSSELPIVLGLLEKRSPCDPNGNGVKEMGDGHDGIGNPAHTKYWTPILNPIHLLD